MIGYSDLQAFGAALLTSRSASEVDVRRAISAFYYGLFHHLAVLSVAVFDHGGAGGPALAAQAARALSHTTTRKVCDAYVRSPRQKLPPPLDKLQPTPPDQRLILVADDFGQLREARERSDYDLRSTFSHNDALLLMNAAEQAHRFLDQISTLPETRIFLTALLVADCWTRRG